MLCLFLSPRNEELEGSCVLHFQRLPEVDIELVVGLGGLGVRVALVEEMMVLAWRQQRRMFLLGAV